MRSHPLEKQQIAQVLDLNLSANRYAPSLFRCYYGNITAWGVDLNPAVAIVTRIYFNFDSLV